MDSSREEEKGKTETDIKISGKKRVRFVGPDSQHWNTYVTALCAMLARRELCIHAGREIPLPNGEPANADRFWIPHIFLRIFFTSSSALLNLPAHSSART